MIEVMPRKGVQIFEISQSKVRNAKPLRCVLQNATMRLQGVVKLSVANSALQTPSVSRVLAGLPRFLVASSSRSLCSLALESCPCRYCCATSSPSASACLCSSAYPKAVASPQRCFLLRSIVPFTASMLPLPALHLGLLPCSIAVGREVRGAMVLDQCCWSETMPSALKCDQHFLISD